MEKRLRLVGEFHLSWETMLSVPFITLTLFIG